MNSIPAPHEEVFTAMPPHPYSYIQNPSPNAPQIPSVAVSGAPFSHSVQIPSQSSIPILYSYPSSIPGLGPASPATVVTTDRSSLGSTPVIIPGLGPASPATVVTTDRSSLGSTPVIIPGLGPASPATVVTTDPSSLSPVSQLSLVSYSSGFSGSLFQAQGSAEQPSPDLECAVCFSQFNNIFRCPKMLQCKHTFCLECLARINVKSVQPDAIQCPLCRGVTPLPSLGLPKLATDPAVLSYLPAAMQKVYSIRFNRSKGKLQVKRYSEGLRRWGQRSRTSLRSVSHSLDVGLPSPTVMGPRGQESEEGGIGGCLFRLTDRPVFRAVLLTSMVTMMVLLTGIVIFLLTFKQD